MNSYTGSSLTDAASSQQDFVRELFSVLLRHWKSLVFWTLFLFTALTVAIQFLPKTYQGTASVEVMSKTPNVAIGNILSSDSQFTEETAGTEIVYFKSPQLQALVIDRLRLMENPEFNPDLHPSKLQAVVEYLHDLPLAHRYVPADWWPVFTPQSPERQQYDTAQVFAKKLQIEPVSHSKIIEVSVITRDPALSSSIVNTMVEEYVEDHQRQKVNAYQSAHRFASDRLPKLRQAMLDTANQVAAFRSKHGIVEGQYSSHVRENLTISSQALMQARSRLADLSAAMEVAKAHPNDILMNPAVLASLTIGRLREEQSKIASDAAARPFQDVVFKSRIAAVEGQIAGEARRIVGALPNEVSAQQQVVASLERSVAQARDAVSVIDTLQAQLDLLNNDASVAKQQYADFMSKDISSSSDVAYTAPEVRIMAKAPIPYRAHFPNNMLMLPAALVLSLVCSSTSIVLRNRKVGVLTPRDFLLRFAMSPLALIPFRTPQLETLFRERIMELGLRLVSRPVDLTASGQRAKVILVTSSQPDEGKTTIASTLAGVMTGTGRKIALVDADMRVAGRNRGRPAGLQDVLKGQITVSDAMVRKDGYFLLPPGKHANHDLPAALIASEKMQATVEVMRANYDIIIIDGPPAPVGGDSWVLAGMADSVLFVVEQGRTSSDQIDMALTALDCPQEKMSVVLNKVRIGDDPTITPKLLSYYSHARH